MSVRLPFRSRPEVGPAGKVTILGISRSSAKAMKGYAERRNPYAPNVAGLYLNIAAAYGVRGDVAFCQAMLDTRTWTAPPGHPPWRPFAHSIWGGGVSDWTPDRLEKMVELHIQYLHAFASVELPAGAASLPDFRMNSLMEAELRGSAVCWEDLNGKWVVPGSHYGRDIVAIWRNMREWHGEEGNARMDDIEQSEPVTDAENNAGHQHADWSGLASEEMDWLRSRGVLPSPVPHPDRRVTWRELAQLLRSWETRGNG